MWLILAKIYIAANTFNIDPTLLYSVCHTETKIRNVVNKHDGGSPSYGLCQVKLKTAQQFYPWLKAKDLMDEYTNVMVAATYLKWQSDRFKCPIKGISAYNAGRPIKGNKKYVNKVLSTMREINENIRNNTIAYR